TVSDLSGRRDPSVTDLLVRWRGGDAQALESLMPLVYDELRWLAHHYLKKERDGHTLQSTALVHEAYLRLVGHDPPTWQNRSHFFRVAAGVMREILVGPARPPRAAEAGRGAPVPRLDAALAVAEPTGVDGLALDEALTELARIDERQSRIVELRFFTGLSIDETADVMGISAATVSREWNTARAWLYLEMSGESRHDS